MTSEYDSTLSIGDVNNQEFKFIMTNSSLKLLNNYEYNNFKIFGLDGKQLVSNASNQLLSEINISQLSIGMYVLMLENKNDFKSFKFIKQ